MRSATLLRSKHDERSVDRITYDSSPIIDQGPISEGVLAPPASKPEDEHCQLNAKIFKLYLQSYNACKIQTQKLYQEL